MLGLEPTGPLGHVLAIGAHSDDIEIGCGGTLLRLAERYPDCAFTWVVLTGDARRQAEARESAAAFLGSARTPDIVAPGLRDGFLPHDPRAKEVLEEVKQAIDPDLVLTHERHDLHQDHRVAYELALQTFRDHVILEYEVPKYDGDLGAPNLFVPLAAELVDRKVAHLLEHFASQRSKRWFTEDLFRGLMRLRGMEAAAASGFAEAFYGRKLVLE